ncbi:MAG: 4-alpha-glucanotransferase, partial [Candidatus Omnitrophica bacterium]|nr:4-alpha-glucanotransferase [Candidatus Omnitrophota bacterium]
MPDMEAAGLEVNWSGLKEYITAKERELGKNLFLLSPVFPTPCASPFTPISVYALSPRFIDWKKVQDRGRRPIDKFNYFLEHENGSRRAQFDVLSSFTGLREYAEFISRKISLGVEQIVYGAAYSNADFVRTNNIAQYVLYEQFVNFEQFLSLIKECYDQGIRILGDFPYYRAKDSADVMFHNQFFAHEEMVNRWVALQVVRIQIMQNLTKDTAFNQALVEMGEKSLQGAESMQRYIEQAQVLLADVETELNSLGAAVPKEIKENFAKSTANDVSMLVGFEVDPPGFKDPSGGNEQCWGDLAGWNERVIDQYVQAGYKDPRQLPFEFWNKVFDMAFGEKVSKISGWRLDALHFYGRGSYRESAQRHIYSTNLWDKLSEFFTDNDLLALVEQLGADMHAFENFKRLGFLQYAFILDLKPKELGALCTDLEGISRGMALTVVDTHDSQRWAKEYSGMFEYLANIDSPQKVNLDRAVETVAPGFLGLICLAPRFETVILSLDEYASTDQIKTEFRDERGVVNRTEWGTSSKGEHDFSRWINLFTKIREENPAISNSKVLLIDNNDRRCLVSFAKSYRDNNIIYLANLSSLEKEISFFMPIAQLFNIGSATRLVFLDLISQDVVDTDSRNFIYTLMPGQVAIFKLVEKKVISHNLTSEPDYGRNAANFETIWDWENKNREVVLAQDSHLIIRNDNSFFLTVRNSKTGLEEAFCPTYKHDKGYYEARVYRLTEGRYELRFCWSDFGASAEHAIWEKEVYHLRVLPKHTKVISKSEPEALSMSLNSEEITEGFYPHNSITLSNGLGSILRIPVRPLARHDYYTSGYTSKYDGFQANLLYNNPDEQRRIIFRGMLEDIEITLKDDSKVAMPLGSNTIESFEAYPLPTWKYLIERDNLRVVITRTVALKEGQNLFVFNYRIVEASKEIKSIEIFIRPELDQRVHHETTKCGGLNWYNSKHGLIKRRGTDKGFILWAIDDQWRNWYPGFEGIAMTITEGKYSFAPEWRHGHNPIEDERGQDSTSDAYSPGFFHACLDAAGQQSTAVTFFSVDCHYHYSKNETKKWDMRQAPYQAYIQGLEPGDYKIKFYWPETSTWEKKPYSLTVLNSEGEGLVQWNWDAKAQSLSIPRNVSLLVSNDTLFYLYIAKDGN